SPVRAARRNLRRPGAGVLGGRRLARNLPLARHLNDRVAVQPSRLVRRYTRREMTTLGDAFGWPFADREWFPKMILQGLIAIIPIVGHIALLGWLLATVDNYRAGRRELAPAGFHLERGIALWAVLLVYVIVLFIPGGIINGIGAASDNGRGLAV